MAGRPLRRARLNSGARSNPVEQQLPPGDYTWMDEDSGRNMDENYEIAMSSDGVFAYKLVGRVMKHDSPKAKALWAAAGTRITPAVLARFATLPDGFYPESTLVGVGFNGNAYNVYLLNEEDVLMQRLAKNISTAAAAELLAKEALAAARTPRAASNPRQRSR